MKRLVLGPLLALIVVACDSPSPAGIAAPDLPSFAAGPPAPTGIAAWWSANRSTRDPLGGNDGILRGDAGYVHGVAGHAFRFDGDGDFVEVASSPALNPSYISIDLWMRGDEDNPMVECCQGLVRTDFYGLEIAPGVGERVGVIMVVATTEGWTHSSDAHGGGIPLVPGRWHHVAGVYDGQHVKLYLDGVLAQESPVTGEILPMLSGSFLSIGAEDGLANEPHLAGNRYFKGAIDEVRIYDHALSDADVAAAYRAHRGRAQRLNTP